MKQALLRLDLEILSMIVSSLINSRFSSLTSSDDDNQRRLIASDKTIWAGRTKTGAVLAYFVVPQSFSGGKKN